MRAPSHHTWRRSSSMWTVTSFPASAAPTEKAWCETEMTPLRATLRVTVVVSGSWGSASSTWGASRRSANRSGGGEHADRLVGADLVVLADPDSSAAWACPRLVDAASARNSSRRVRWKRSIFPVVVGERTPVSRCVMPFWRQIRSNSTSDGVRRMPAREHLAVVGQDFVGHAMVRASRPRTRHTQLGRLPVRRARPRRRTGSNHRHRSAPSAPSRR